jgi:hypothetical protein
MVANSSSSGGYPAALLSGEGIITYAMYEGSPQNLLSMGDIVLNLTRGDGA